MGPPPPAHGWLPEPRQGRPPRSGSAASVSSWGPPWLCRLMQIASASSQSKLSSGTMKPAGISSFDGWHPTVALGMFGQNWQLLLASNRVVPSGPAFVTVWYPVPRGQVTLPTCKASRLLRLHSLALQHLSSRTVMLPPETIVLVLPAKIAVLSVTFCAAKTASPVVASQSRQSTTAVALILPPMAQMAPPLPVMAWQRLNWNRDPAKRTSPMVKTPPAQGQDMMLMEFVQLVRLQLQPPMQGLQNSNQAGGLQVPERRRGNEPGLHPVPPCSPPAPAPRRCMRRIRRKLHLAWG